MPIVYPSQPPPLPLCVQPAALTDPVTGPATIAAAQAAQPLTYDTAELISVSLDSFLAGASYDVPEQALRQQTLCHLVSILSTPRSFNTAYATLSTADVLQPVQLATACATVISVLQITNSLQNLIRMWFIFALLHHGDRQCATTIRTMASILPDVSKKNVPRRVRIVAHARRYPAHLQYFLTRPLQLNFNTMFQLGVKKLVDRNLFPAVVGTAAAVVQRRAAHDRR